jgi:hypothetical protein
MHTLYNAVEEQHSPPYDLGSDIDILTLSSLSKICNRRDISSTGDGDLKNV